MSKSVERESAEMVDEYGPTIEFGLLTSEKKTLSPEVTTNIPTTKGNMDEITNGNVIKMDIDFDVRNKPEEKEPVSSDEGQDSEASKPYRRPSLKDIMRIGTHEGETVIVEPNGNKEDGDPSLGFGDEANLKVKFLGFGKISEKLLYPLIERESNILFDIIKELEAGGVVETLE